MEAEMAAIDPEALRITRKAKHLSQRELGRRVAVRMDQKEQMRNFQMRLNRIEKRDRLSHEDREWVDAVAAELALGSGDDLAEPPLWIWITVTAGTPGYVQLALRIPTFTTPENAYNARDQLGLATGGALTPFADAHLVPFNRASLYGEILDENYTGGLLTDERRLLVDVDPTVEDIVLWATVNMTLNTDLDQREVDQLIEMAAELIYRFPDTVAEMIRLHDLALRRLVHAPPAAAHLLSGWKRQEARLYAIVKKIDELRAESRDAAIRDLPQ